VRSHWTCFQHGRQSSALGCQGGRLTRPRILPSTGVYQSCERACKAWQPCLQIPKGYLLVLESSSSLILPSSNASSCLDALVPSCRRRNEVRLARWQVAMPHPPLMKAPQAQESINKLLHPLEQPSQWLGNVCNTATLSTRPLGQANTLRMWRRMGAQPSPWHQTSVFCSRLPRVPPCMHSCWSTHAAYIRHCSCSCWYLVMGTCIAAC
jgi:hypothetical protein